MSDLPDEKKPAHVEGDHLHPSEGMEESAREVMNEPTGGGYSGPPRGDFVPEFPGAMPASVSVTGKALRSRTLYGDAWYRLRRNKLALVALTWLLILSFAAVTADLWVAPLYGSPYTYDTAQTKEALQSPSFKHPMGTDNLGQDIFASVVYGARVSLTVGILAVAISVVIGLFLGALSGYYGGWGDAVIMRVTDIFLAFPYILFCILVLALLPPQVRGIWPMIAVIGLLGWTSFARVFRSSILSVKENDYVDAARAVGANSGRIMFRHIAPNAMAPIVVYATISIGGAILTESALSFLGLGIKPPTPSWGAMIDQGRNFLTSNPGLVLWPGLAIVSTVMAFTLLGDGFRDALDVKTTE